MSDEIEIVPAPEPSREAVIVAEWKAEQFGNRGLDVVLFNHITQACGELVRRLEKKE